MSGVTINIVAMTAAAIPGLDLIPMTRAHRGLRAEATMRNVNRTGDRIGVADLEQEPWSRYLDFHPERGDHGFVAAIDGHPAGAVWVVFDRGYGHVADTVPELVISVDASQQGQGIGNVLLELMVTHAKDSRWPGISLSVEEANPARRLYERHGFRPVPVGGPVLHPGTMLLDLGGAPAGGAAHEAPVIRAVAVYCGSRAGFDAAYLAAAEELGRELARRDIRLIYGGGNVGLMGAVANSVLSAGGEAVGVIPQSLVNREIAHHGLSRLEVVDTMAQRKTRMEDLADAFVVMPGGAGTLEEAFEVLTMQQLGEIDGPIALLNTVGFWSPLVDMLQQMSDQGFLRRKFVDALVVADTPQELFAGFSAWRDPGDKWD